MPNKKNAFIVLISLFFLSTCGLEEYYYLPRIPTGNVRIENNTRAVIRLPGHSEIFFTGFTIFYRIYISGADIAGTVSESQLSTINSSLDTDYRSIYPSTTTDSASGTTINSLFSGRRYYTLYLEGANITNVLDDNSGNGSTSLNLDFLPVGQPPTLTLTNTASAAVIDGPYNLLRSNNGGAFSPLPSHRRFLNHDDLNSNANAISTVNADTAASSSVISGTRHTYVSMYIAVTGFDSNNFSPIYSNPTFIGIFHLSDG